MLEIIPSTSEHVRELSKTIRQADKEEAIAAGLVPHKALFYAYKRAFYRRTALINGNVAAMWGVLGSPLGVLGQPYLVTGEYVSDIRPTEFVRAYKNEVQIMSKMFSLLENYVDARYTSAIKLLKLAGFEVSEPMTTMTGFNFCKYSKKGSV